MIEKRLCGIRGAIVVRKDEAQEIIEATQALLTKMVEENDINPVDDIVSIIFTTTPDLHSEFPAKAARLLGWAELPLLGALEMDKPGALRQCIRVLIHAYTLRNNTNIQHIYLRGAEVLRPDRQQCTGEEG